MTIVEHAEAWAKVLGFFIGGYAAFKLGGYNALKADLETYKGRCETLEKEVKELQTCRAADKAALAELRAKTDLTPVLAHMTKQTELLERMCEDARSHRDSLKSISESQTRLATLWETTFQPAMQQAIERNTKNDGTSENPSAQRSRRGSGRQSAH